jgi:acyl carrier protein
MSHEGRVAAIERWLVGACRELGLQVEDAESDFFEAGGSSLTAVKLLARVEDRFGEEALPAEDLFAESRLREMANRIHQNSRQSELPADA